MNFTELPYSLRSLVTWIGSTVGATAIFWMCFGTCVAGCIDEPLPAAGDPQARIVAAWDPLSCGDPHRVVIELEDDDGAKLSRSVPCELGGVTIDIRHWGVYRGRIYAWSLGPEIWSVKEVQFEVDSPVIYWTVETPH